MNGNSPFSIPLIHNAVDIMTPFLLAGIGGLFTELAGMLNIALEGLILTGAFFSIVFAAATGNLLRTLSNPTPADGDSFGWSVGVSGSTVVALMPINVIGPSDRPGGRFIPSG